MFISESNKRATLRTLIIYAGVTAFVALFGAVYEVFSHNVYSANMVFAWVYPLVFGIALLYLPLFLLSCFSKIKYVPGTIPACVYNFGVAMVTIRSIFIGVVEIYGRTNKNMVAAYTVLSILFLVAGALLIIGSMIYPLIKKDKVKKEA